jgi:hypothetical protein
MVKKLSHIYEGWTKSLGLAPVTEDEKNLANARVKICVQCPHASEMWLKKLIAGILKNDELGSGIGCTICGCPVMEKALVTRETCPDGRW